MKKAYLLKLLIIFFVFACSKNTTITESEASLQEAFSSQEFTNLKNAYNDYLAFRDREFDDLISKVKSGEIDAFQHAKLKLDLKQKCLEIESDIKLLAKKFHSKYPDAYKKLGYENFSQEIIIDQ